MFASSDSSLRGTSDEDLLETPITALCLEQEKVSAYSIKDHTVLETENHNKKRKETSITLADPSFEIEVPNCFLAHSSEFFFKAS